MVAILGDLGIIVALVSSAMLAYYGFRAMRNPGRSQGANLKLSVYGMVGGAFLAMLALEFGLITNDFSVEYIANNSASTTPFLYRVASAWGALEGSIVLWGLVLALFALSVFVVSQRRGAADPLGAGALGVMGLVAVFFFGLMATISDPFRVCVEAASAGCFSSSVFPWADAVAPAQGLGPNPLLQNHPLMAVHPPTLYVGYIGLTVPYAFAMAALMRGASGLEWLQRTRSWTLFAWMFLTAGIVLGGLWSYEVLSWGGFWAWDPVENASFMPWLVATAFIHSSVVQARRGMLQAWNFVLVITAFALTILGTFLTRSGVITSVHSFTQSPIGPALLWFLVVVLVGSFALFAARAHVVASSPRLDSLASREGVFLANNLLLSVFAIIVLTGTLYPMFVDAFTGDQVGVGRPFFDRMAVPIAFLLLLAMGIGPVTPWRSARWSVVWSRIRLPLQVALAAAALAVVAGYRNKALVLAILTATFVVAVIIRHLVVTARTVSRKREIGFGPALVRVARSDPGFWGGQISHVGVAILAVGIAFSSGLAVRQEVTLAPGETATVAGWDLTFTGTFARPEASKDVFGANIEVARGGSVEGVFHPLFNQYPRQTIATPAVDTTLRGDLYLAPKLIEGESVTLDVFWFPVIWLVWVGGFLAALAALYSRFVRKPAAQDQATEVARRAP